MVPELDANRVRVWASARVSEHARDQIRIEVEETPRGLTIVECRPPWMPELGSEWSRNPVARLSYVKARGEWTLHAFDRNSRVMRYDYVEPTTDVRLLLAEIDADPTCIFWG